ncbi:transglutaminase domain-containing protein [Flavobacterium sp.]|uniref:DUF3857 domain-containing protein n=1 Tax=Flavobacterium sp. TaxID=239 RepID=UPI0032666A4F
MKRFQLFTLLSLLFIFSEAFAQDFRLGKVSIAEIEQKNHPTDTAAIAAILYKKGVSRFEYNDQEGFIILTDVETRIKIYKKEGYQWANHRVWFYTGTNANERVSFSDANTFNIVNGKIEKTKLKSDGVFDEVINKFRAQKKITMPNVKEGSVIEYRYNVKTNLIGELRDWDFQTSIPVNHSEFISYVPEYFVFNVKQKGFVFPKVTTNKTARTINYVDVTDYKDGTPAIRTPRKLDFVETVTKYAADNFPSIKEEEYVNNMDNYVSSVQHELSMTQYPNQAIKTYSTNWNSVVKTIYEYDDFGPELNKKGYFEEDLKKVISNATTQNEKIVAILNFVKSNVKWNNYYGYSCDSGVKKAYKEKTGNVADINLMLTAMLRSEGITANPVLVSTRSNGIALFPNRSAFNYVIAAVETSEGTMLLDASDEFSVPNILPLRALNWYGRLIRKDGTSEEIDLMPKKTSNDIVLVSYSIDSEGKITGKSRRQCSDYNAMIFRDNVKGVKEDDYLDKLENDQNKIEISEYTRTNEKELLLPFSETYSFTSNDLCEKIDGKIYLNPMLFFQI